MTPTRQRRSPATGRLRRAMAREDGFTLVELLVTMLLFGIVGSVVASTFVTTVDSAQNSTFRQDNTRLSQVAMQTLTKSIRAGSKIERSGLSATAAFTVATPTSIGMYAFVGTRPTLLTYTIDSSQQLVETRLPADASSTAPYWTFTGTPTSRIVISRVVNTTGQPLFTYYNGAGPGVAFAPVAGDTASLDAIRSVDVTLVVQTRDDARVPPAYVEQRIYLPNLGSIG